MMKPVFFVILLVLAGISNSSALDLTEAKASGLVGEGNDGYLGLVTKSPSSEIRALVEDVNTKRKAKFASAAKTIGATLRQVTHRFYTRAIAETKPGDYYQDSAGYWVRK